MAIDFEASSSQYATFTAAHTSLSGATLMCWIRLESISGNNVIINISGAATNTARMTFRVNSTDSKIIFSCRRINGDAVTNCNGATALSTGVTYHLACVADYTGSRMDFYLNGVSDGSTTSISGWGAASDSNASAGGALGGRADGGAGNFLDGLLQDARFYQRALTSAEVLDAYRGGLGGTAPRNWWELTTDTGTAGTITDTQGNANATAQASPVYAANIRVFTCAMAQGAYTLSGQALALSYGRSIALAQGSYALAGQNVALSYSSAGTSVQLAQGSLAIAGQALGLFRGRYLRISGVYGVGIGSSTLKGTVGSPPPTTPWRTRFSTGIAALVPGSSFGHLGENGYTTYHLLPAALDGTANRPAVDAARNIDAAIAQRPHFIIVNVNSDVNAAISDWGFTYATLANVLPEVKANLLAIYAEALASGVPIWFCTPQPTDIDTGGNDALYQAALIDLRDWTSANLPTIDFWTPLVAGGGDNSADDSLISDDRHPNDAGCQALADEALAELGSFVSSQAAGAYHIGGRALALEADRRLTMGQGALTVSGQAVNLAAGKRVALAQGSFAITGFDLNTATGLGVSLQGGSYTITGNALATQHLATLVLQHGALAISGADAALRVGHTVALAQGAFTIGGQALATAVTRALALARGDFVLTGHPVAFDYSAAIDFVGRVLSDLQEASPTSSLAPL